MQPNLLSRPLFTAFITYCLAIGATFNGVFIPQITGLTLPLLTLIFTAWVFLHLHLRHGRKDSDAHALTPIRWYRTPFDGVLMLWGGAIAFSFVMNVNDWRRMLIGGWYVGLYMLIWFIVTDLLHNRWLRRSALVDGVLFAGVLIVGIGYWQVLSIVFAGWRYPDGLFGLPRPVSLIGNANSLGAILVVLIGFTAGRFFSVKARWQRVILGIYFMLTLLLLILTYSRGAWLGGGAALMVAAVLWALHQGVRSPAQVIAILRNQRLVVQIVILITTVMLLVGGALVGIILLNSLTQPGRTAELRTYIWDAALQMFSERPLSGWGLFTFGKGLQTFASMPPLTPHSHAHNVVLHVLAELGIVGAAVMSLSVIVIVWAIRQNWQTITASERPILISGIAAAIGFGIHHLLDTPFMMPSIALSGIVALLVAVPLATPIPMAWQWRARGHGAGLMIAGVVLLVVGYHDHNIYRMYINTLQVGIQAEDYLETANQLEAIIANDPANPIYHWQQGMFYGLAANKGDAAAAQLGIVAFENALRTEPQNAVFWANLAALQWQTGDLQNAVTSFEQAANAARQSWQLALIFAEHALDADLLSVGCAAYQHALTLEPALRLLERGQRALTACDLSLESLPPLDGLALVVEHILQGEFATAAQTWDAAPIPTASGYVVRAMIAHELGEAESAFTWLRRAEGARFSENDTDDAWVLYGQAVLNNQTDPAAFVPIINLITPATLDADYATGINVGRAIWLREVIAQQFLPQVGYESRDFLLLVFLEIQYK